MVLSAEMVISVNLRSWWTPQQGNRLMDAVECMEVYQREQKHRKARLKVELQHGAGCLLIGQERGSLFPNMRVRHGLHMQEPAFFNFA